MGVAASKPNRCGSEVMAAAAISTADLVPLGPEVSTRYAWPARAVCTSATTSPAWTGARRLRKKLDHWAEDMVVSTTRACTITGSPRPSRLPALLSTDHLRARLNDPTPRRIAEDVLSTSFLSPRASDNLSPYLFEKSPVIAHSRPACSCDSLSTRTGTTRSTPARTGAVNPAWRCAADRPAHASADQTPSHAGGQVLKPVIGTDRLRQVHSTTDRASTTPSILAIELGTPEFEKFLPAGSAKVILRDIVAGPQQIN